MSVYESRREQARETMQHKGTSNYPSRDSRYAYGNASRTNTGAKPIPFSGLLSNKILTALPGADFARLLPYLEPVSLSLGENLYELGSGYAYFPETAVISQVHLLRDGSSVAGAIIGKDGMSGLSDLFGARAPQCLALVIVAGTALRIRTEALRLEFSQYEPMQRELLSYTGARMEQLSQRAVCNTRHVLEARLCTWLLLVQDRAGETRLPLTHEEIARHLGVRRAGVTEVLIELRERGLVNYQRGLIRIMDRQGLEVAACECYRALNPISVS